MRKGFTIVELAIVLVVIGIIMSMAVKGKALIRTAIIKADIVKIEKMRTAMYTAYAIRNGKEFDLVPPGAGGVREGYDQKVLFQMGLLQPKDMVSDIVNQTWQIHKCAVSADVPYNCTFEQYTLGRSGCAPTMRVGTCITLNSPSGPSGTTGHEPSLFCYYEHALDDDNFSAGYGKHASHHPYKPYFPSEDFEDCDAMPTQKIKWMYQIL